MCQGSLVVVEVVWNSFVSFTNTFLSGLGLSALEDVDFGLCQYEVMSIPVRKQLDSLDSGPIFCYHGYAMFARACV